MSGTHARLSPSGSKRWISCAGSIVLESAFPNESSQHADNGTACHAVAAECLTSDGALQPSDWLMEKVKVSDPHEPDRFVEFTEDLCTMTTGYVDEIRELTKGLKLHVEQRLEFTEWIQIESEHLPPGVEKMEEQFGTIDAHWLREIDFAPSVFEIAICDLKSGYKFVATDSSQLKIYALAVLGLYELTHDIAQIRLMIYQPRHGGMREEVISVEDLRAFAVTLKEAARRVEVATERYEPMVIRGDADMWAKIHLNPNPNEEDCAFCRAMATCPAARTKFEVEVGADFDVIAEHSTPTQEATVLGAMPFADPARLSGMMKIAGFLEDWIKAVRGEVERRLLAGGDVPDFGLELGRQGARAWSDDVAVETMVRKQFRIKADDAYTMKMKSPTQLEKLAVVKAPTKKNPDPPKPVISPAQWAKLQPFIRRSDAVPSVKPAAHIKEPYSVVKADESAFDVVEKQPAAGGEELW